jgi:hypothetical protein
MTLLHGFGLLALGLLVSMGVFYLISIAEHKETEQRRRTALDDFRRRQNN